MNYAIFNALNHDNPFFNLKNDLYFSAMYSLVFSIAAKQCREGLTFEAGSFFLLRLRSFLLAGQVSIVVPKYGWIVKAVSCVAATFVLQI